MEKDVTPRNSFSAFSGKRSIASLAFRRLSFSYSYIKASPDGNVLGHSLPSFSRPLWLWAFRSFRLLQHTLQARHKAVATGLDHGNQRGKSLGFSGQDLFEV